MHYLQFFQVSRCLTPCVSNFSVIFIPPARRCACCLCVHECASLLGRRTSASSSAFTSPLSIRSLHFPPTSCSLCVMKVTHVGVIQNDWARDLRWLVCVLAGAVVRLWICVIKCVASDVFRLGMWGAAQVCAVHGNLTEKSIFFLSFWSFVFSNCDKLYKRLSGSLLVVEQRLAH